MQKSAARFAHYEQTIIEITLPDGSTTSTGPREPPPAALLGLLPMYVITAWRTARSSSLASSSTTTSRSWTDMGHSRRGGTSTFATSASSPPTPAGHLRPTEISAPGVVGQPVEATVMPEMRSGIARG
jgi:hypothetical protein